MNELASFSPDYQTARDSFCAAVRRLAWDLESYPLVGLTGPAGETLAVDIAQSTTTNPCTSTLVLSSGLHGVEGHFGSAVILHLLERWQAESSLLADLRVVILHSLNPFGFAWSRRFDQENIDSNRNFLLPGEEYAGSPAGYAQLDRVLNPRRPPAAFDLFPLQALASILQQGLPALQQAIAAGQYDFPRGLFYGGAGPASVHQLMAAHLDRWLAGSETVVHLDFHTGLGRWGTDKLLIDYPLTDQQTEQLTSWFGADTFQTNDSTSRAYSARGDFGHWCVDRFLATNYLYACAEFGTYSPYRVLSGLRWENQAHHWGQPGDSATRAAKERLRELFCPASPEWRRGAVRRGAELVAQAIGGLTGSPASRKSP
jgi:hypothetical protein